MIRNTARRRRILVVLAIVGVTVQLTACGSDAPTRSVKNFCDTYNSEKAKFERKYAPREQSGGDQSGGAILANLMLSLQSLGDASVILTKLDKVAPNDIEPDVKAVLKSWKSMQDTLGDEASNAFNPTGLVGAMLKGLLASAESGGSWTRLGNYVTKHCTVTQ